MARPDHDEAFYDYVYLRDNPIGPVREHWYHAQGCRNWLLVTRDTATHEISQVVLAKGAVQ
jgi:methylglutamate dehydrogenase subunit B